MTNFTCVITFGASAGTVCWRKGLWVFCSLAVMDNLPHLKCFHSRGKAICPSVPSRLGETTTFLIFRRSFACRPPSLRSLLLFLTEFLTEFLHICFVSSFLFCYNTRCFLYEPGNPIVYANYAMPSLKVDRFKSAPLL